MSLRMNNYYKTKGDKRFSFVSFGSVKEYLYGRNEGSYVPYYNNETVLALCVEYTDKVVDYYFVEERSICPFDFMNDWGENKVEYYNFAEERNMSFDNIKGDLTKDFSENISIIRRDKGYSFDYFLLLKDQWFLENNNGSLLSSGKKVIYVDDIEFFLFSVNKKKFPEGPKIYYNDKTVIELEIAELIEWEKKSTPSEGIELLRNIIDNKEKRHLQIERNQQIHLASSNYHNNYYIYNRKTEEKWEIINGKEVLIDHSGAKQKT
ncbi:hypothetical protein [Cytobacillus sp. IB215316]|uniref:hypothetical protein n=1 Tax=Cytobacillus sp. IB215316 TaxID=3097354 RepID=UPI002A1796BF|nr:hypothetical protein [Cytobacillus sp. IB215316]MDX8359838.1 hypothetical protein [Cytobacillus sp. IB215316]